MMYFIITNDGGANNFIADAFFKVGSTYTTMGASYSSDPDCTMVAATT